MNHLKNADQHPQNQPLKNQLTLLQNLLNQQAEVYSDVEKQMIQKQHILIEGDPNKLASVDQTLAILGQRLTQLENQRIELLEAMGHQDKTLNEVLQTLPQHQTKTLRESRSHLIRSIKNIKIENDKTRSLLNLSIRWVEETVELIANALVPEAGTYNATGVKSNRTINETTGPLAPSTIQRDA